LIAPVVGRNQGGKPSPPTSASRSGHDTVGAPSLIAPAVGRNQGGKPKPPTIHASTEVPQSGTTVEAPAFRPGTSPEKMRPLGPAGFSIRTRHSGCLARFWKMWEAEAPNQRFSISARHSGCPILDCACSRAQSGWEDEASNHPRLHKGAAKRHDGRSPGLQAGEFAPEKMRPLGPATFRSHTTQWVPHP
jgi:hypothetical protein